MFSDFIYNMWHLTVEMAPFLLLGFIMAGILNTYIPVTLVSKHLGGNSFTSVLKSAFIGIPLPLCSCGVLPVAASLKKSGASDSATVSFLITTPVTGVDSLLATGAVLGWFFTLVRLISSFLIGISAGVLSTVIRSDLNNKNVTDENSCSGKNCGISYTKSKSSLMQKIIDPLHYAFIELPLTMSSSMLVGLLFAGVIATLIPDNFFANNFAGNNYYEILAAMLLAVPLYVCATGSIPVAAALMMKGISPGAALAFMIAGPATNAVAISTVKQLMGGKLLAVYLFSISAGAFVSGIATDAVIRNTNIYIPLSAASVHSADTAVSTVFGAILLIILVYGYTDSEFNISDRIKHFMKREKKMTGNRVLQLIVPDMTCNHCKMNILKILKSFDSITNSEVDLANKTVRFEYKDNFDMDTLTRKMREAGYPPQL